MSNARFVVSGHSLTRPEKSARESHDRPIYMRASAFCSCGAWADNLTGSACRYSAWSRKWHENHKIEVLRKRGELEEGSE